MFSLFSHSLPPLRRFKGGMLEAHPKEKAIVVNYKLEAAVYGDGDVVDPMLADKKVISCLFSIHKQARTYSYIAKASLACLARHDSFRGISMP